LRAATRFERSADTTPCLSRVPRSIAFRCVINQDQHLDVALMSQIRDNERAGSASVRRGGRGFGGEKRMSTTTRITHDQYNAMIERGDFSHDPRRLELIHGEIRIMSPLGDRYLEAVDELTEWTFDVVPSKTIRVRVQGAIGIPQLESAPQPDVAWLKRRNYRLQPPLPEDVVLLIEVSDRSLEYDRGENAALYASAQILDYWMVNIPERCIEVRRNPLGSTYRSIEVFHTGLEVRPLAFPDRALPVDRLFPAE
jgi:Uma2 family endonuclease